MTDLSREHGIGAAMFYKWTSGYGGMDASVLRRVKEPKAENDRLKRIYANVQLEAHVMKESLATSGVVRRPTGGGSVASCRARFVATWAVGC